MPLREQKEVKAVAFRGSNREQWVTGRPPWGEGSDYTENEMENYTEVFIDHFERATDKYGVRLRWGQLSRTNRFDPDRYDKFRIWLQVRNRLTRNRSIRTFENNFSWRHLNPQSDVALRGPNGKLVAAEGGGGRELNANRDRRSTWETFKIIHLPSNYIALRTYHGQYVSVDPNGGTAVVADGTDIGPWESFALIRLEDGKVAFHTRNGHYIGLDQRGRLVADKDDPADASFELESTTEFVTILDFDHKDLRHGDFGIDVDRWDLDRWWDV